MKYDNIEKCRDIDGILKKYRSLPKRAKKDRKLPVGLSIEEILVMLKFNLNDRGKQNENNKNIR